MKVIAAAMIGFLTFPQAQAALERGSDFIRTKEKFFTKESLEGEPVKSFRTVTIRNWGIFNNVCLRKVGHGCLSSHINVVEAWKISQGSSRVVVAVVDTGINALDPQLKANLWRNPKDPKVFGYDFVTNSPNPVDENGHGTHVAGIIGAKADSDRGIVGVAQNVSLMPVRYYSPKIKAEENLKNTVKALRYAVDNGARIINYSGGGLQPASDERAVVLEAERKGILLVAAAGNEGQNISLGSPTQYFPASYGIANTITVAAYDIQGQILPRSNYGNTVDVAAPGHEILSNYVNGQAFLMTGTSQATAYVTGVAALLLSVEPTLTPRQVKEIIMSSAVKMPGLEGKVRTAGRVDAAAALAYLQQLRKPAKVADAIVALKSPQSVYQALKQNLTQEISKIQVPE